MSICKQKKLLVPIVIVNLLISSGFAIAGECDVALSERAFNTSDSNVVSRVAKEQVDNVCNKIYDSEVDANSSGKSMAGSLGYGAISIGASQVKQNSSTKWVINNSEFCKNSSEKINSEFLETNKTSIANYALNAWSKCIETNSDKNVVYLSFTPNENGMVGQIIRRPGKVGSFGKIQGVLLQEKDPANEVECKIDSKPIPLNTDISIPFTKPITNISCTKPTNRTIHISLETDQNSDEWLTLQSAQSQREIDLEKMRDSIGDITKKLAKIEDNLTALNSRVYEIEGKKIENAKYFQITYQKLADTISLKNPGCTNDAIAISGNLKCASEIQSYCLKMDYSGGFAQQATPTEIGFICVK